VVKWISTFAMCFVVGSPAAGQQRSPFEPVPEPISDTLSFHIPLADFEAKDLTNRVWHTSDMHSKITVIGTWAVDFPPCHQYLPALQAFNAEVKRDRAIQVLTFSVDDDVSRVRTYMRAKGYTFPVIVNKRLEFNLLPRDAILPGLVIIDREGRRSDPFREWTFGRILLEAKALAKRK